MFSWLQIETFSRFYQSRTRLITFCGCRKRSLTLFDTAGPSHHPDAVYEKKHGLVILRIPINKDRHVSLSDKNSVTGVKY